MVVEKRCSLHWIEERRSKGVAITPQQRVASSKLLINKQHVAS
jgi:hypothetical protein